MNDKPDWWMLWLFFAILVEILVINIALEIMWGNYHVIEYRGEGKWFIGKEEVIPEKGICLE